MKPKQQHIVLSTKNLSIGYRQKTQTNIVFSNVNLSIKKGQLISVLGKNGIGKSTLLRTITNILKPIEGEVFINQKNINTYSDKELAKTISLVLTERLPESQLTVFDLIALGRQPYTNWIDTLSTEDLEKINWAIQETQLEDLQNHRFYELSDGQLQRVLIARALAQDTEMILLDEPTAHLDMQQTVIIFELLKKLTQTTNKTILISTHELNLATQMSDALILLTENKIYSGATCTLTQEGAFEKLFSSEIVKFNRNLQQFVINKN